MDGSEPCRQNGCVSFGRTLAAIQTRACLSMAKLCALVWLVQIRSSLQYGDAAAGGTSASLGVFGSRTFSLICVALFLPGSTTGM